MPTFVKHAPYEVGGEVTAADMNRIEQGISDAINYPSPTSRHINSFAGATTTDKLRQAILDCAGMTYKPVIRFDPGMTIDAGTEPIDLTLCDGFTMMGSDSPELEFGSSFRLNVRHTGGGTAVFRLGRRTKIINVTMAGLTSTNIFESNPTDGSGYVPEYPVFWSLSIVGCNRIYSGAGLGWKWGGPMSLQTFSADGIPLVLTGSDHDILSDGVFWEMGSPGGATSTTYNKKAALDCMLKIAATKTRVGPIYTTGSCTTPYWVTGGSGGVTYSDGTTEGRPVPGSGPNYLWCAGELFRLTGGGAIIRQKWLGYAMRDPAATGRNPGGFIHITGGEHLIDGGTFQPYTAGNYGAYTAGSYNHPAGAIPPLVYITGGHVKVRNILRGPNCAGAKPVVRCTSIDMVDADTSVEIKLMTA